MKKIRHKTASVPAASGSSAGCALRSRGGARRAQDS
ncbi:hypothetical protein A2U01_0116452 [Trifolium medium]|uniref:Lipoprotein n=1 Tax=Trifolium medium TaxID=97028 RepID=A0A392W3A7_9FABA|nr:hypothetical protein [Trifolium medium]